MVMSMLGCMSTNTGEYPCNAEEGRARAAQLAYSLQYTSWLIVCLL